jgi:hypothetical protein
VFVCLCVCVSMCENEFSKCFCFRAVIGGGRVGGGGGEEEEEKRGESGGGGRGGRGTGDEFSEPKMLLQARPALEEGERGERGREAGREGS